MNDTIYLVVAEWPLAETEYSAHVEYKAQIWRDNTFDSEAEALEVFNNFVATNWKDAPNLPKFVKTIKVSV